MNPVTSLTAAELLEKWKHYRFYDPPRLDCSVKRIDSVDTDAIIMQEINRWYLDLLDTLPPHQLPAVEVADRLSLTRTPSGAGLVSLPDCIYRVTSITLDSWQQPASIVSPDSRIARAQTSVYSRAASCRPVAVAYRRFLHLFTPRPALDGIASCTALLYPTDESYLFTPHMLSLISSQPL